MQKKVVKVELGYFDDMIKYEKKGDDANSLAKKEIRKYKDTFESAIHNYGIALDVGEKALKMAKDLGADDLIKLYTKTINRLQGGIKENKRYIDKIKSI